MLVEIKVGRIREAAAKLPQPVEGKLEKPDSAIDAGIRKTAENHPVGNETVTVASQTVDRVDELLGPAPVSAETKQTETKPAATKPATKPAEPAKPAE